MNNSGITILNVDGGAAGRYVKTRILREAGYTVIEAMTGAEALRLTSDAKPQLVLLSVNLPDLNGLEVGRRIKTDPATSSALVLLVSASFVGCEKRARSLEEGADGYLLEPVTADFLLANVKTLLRLRKDDGDRDRLLADERRQTGALKKLAGAAIAINSASSLDEILQIVTDQAREVVGAHQAVTTYSAGVAPANVLPVGVGWSRAVNAVSLSEKHAGWSDFGDGCAKAWVGSLVCRLNVPMRLTQDELESRFVLLDGAGRTVGAPPDSELAEGRATSEAMRREGSGEDAPPAALALLEGIMTPRELLVLRDMTSAREVAPAREALTPLEMAMLREITSLRDPQILRGLELRGWMAAPLTSRDGRNLGLIQLSDKYEGEFTEQDEAVLVQLAQMVSVAIENRQLYRLEQAAREAAENASRAKDEFLAMISHKLRTPLNAMLGWAWVLQRQTDGAEAVARAAEIIERNARAQVRLVEDLLEASRVIAGKLRLDIKPFDLVQLIHSACDGLRPSAEAKGVDMRLKVDPEAGTITGDPDRLQQVVWNLISNAIKFTPGGGRVEVRLELAGESLRLTVTDTGRGISADLLPTIFDRFRQGVAPGSARAGGLGLGLAMARHLVELHGGSVTASSPGEGLGATFAVKLPLNAFGAGQGPDAAREWMIAGEVGLGAGSWVKWERGGLDLPVSPAPHLPVPYSPAPTSRGMAAGGC
jgi:signal transduction histidine kinase/DNA-binding response OmpR family regulator